MTDWRVLMSPLSLDTCMFIYLSSSETWGSVDSHGCTVSVLLTVIAVRYGIGTSLSDLHVVPVLT